MKRKTLLTLMLVFVATCPTSSVSQSRKGRKLNRKVPRVLTTATPTSGSRVDVNSTESVKKKDVPAEFAKVDFANLSYPVDWKKKRIQLKNGRRIYNDPEDYWNSFDLGKVHYIDLPNGGKKEAMVELFWVHCGGSCDEGSYLFYFYAIRRGKLTMLQRISTGSFAYGCGLKSFKVDKGAMTIEVFRKCSYSGGTFVSKQQYSKYEAHEITRFIFRFARGKFALEKREVLPNPSGDVLN